MQKKMKMPQQQQTLGKKRSTIFRQRNGIGIPRLIRFERTIEKWLLSVKEQRNANRLKLGKSPLTLVAVIEDILRPAMLKQKARRN